MKLINSKHSLSLVQRECGIEMVLVSFRALVEANRQIYVLLINNGVKH
jgi:hypothetical protein